MMQPFTLRSLGAGTLLGACFLCATGCSQQIYTRVEKSYPADSHGTEVIVFQPEETPPPAEVLGKITIGDADMPDSLDYDDVLGLARIEVRRIGGNGLHVTSHLKPSLFGSSCHQIEGRMLCFADSVYAALLLPDRAARPDTIRPLTSAGTPPALLPQTPRDFPAHRPRITRADTVASVQPLPAPVPQRRHTLYAHVGYAFIFSKVIMPEDVSGNPRHGFDFNLGYNCLLKNGWGFGVRYARYSTSLTGTVNGTTLTDHISLHHIGPEVTLQIVKHRWTIGGAVGVGYAHYQEKVRDLKTGVGGFGLHLSFNAEYMLGRKVGLGINISEITSQFKPEKFGSDNAGIGRISLTAGLRVHF